MFKFSFANLKKLAGLKPKNKKKSGSALKNPDQELFARLEQGRPFACCASDYVRDQIALKNPDRARSFAQALRDDPTTEQVGTIAYAVFAHHSAHPVLAAQLFEQTDHAVALATAPLEYIASVYRKDPTRATQLVRDNAINAAPVLRFGLACVASEYKDLATALEIVREPLSPTEIAASGANPVRYNYLRDALLRWEAGRAPAANNLPNAVRFGLIDYRMLDYSRASMNVGDYVQTLALLSNVVRFSNAEFHGAEGLGAYANQLKARVSESKRLPQATQPIELVPVSRDFASSDAFAAPLWMVAYGWYMHPNFKTFFDFPFAPGIRPIFISFHVNTREFLTTESVEYLRQYQPIGCRDWTTVYILREFGIEAFFSGCMTTTLGKLFPSAGEGVSPQKTALVDYEGPLEGWDSVVFQHSTRNVRELDFVGNLEVADGLLWAYRKFKRIATSRLHCYLPCSALGLDVVFKPKRMSDIRFEGLGGLDVPAVGQMGATIEAKLADVLGLIFSGAAEESVYARWKEICADDVAFAESYRQKIPDFPLPSFDVPTAIGKVLASAWSKQGAADAANTKPVSLAFAADKNVWEALPVAIDSVLSACHRTVLFHILCRSLSKADWQKLSSVFPAAHFSFYDLEAISYGGKPRLPKHTTLSALDRLLLPSLLPALDRVIYLDTDVWVRGDISALWDIELGAHKLACATPGPDSKKLGYNLVYPSATALEYRKAQALRRRMHAEGPLSFRAFNAGVLVLNLEKMRADRFEETWLPLVEQYNLDAQAVLNVYARLDRMEVDAQWNVVPGQDLVTDAARIVHFSGTSKPWGEAYTVLKPIYLARRNQLSNPH